MIDMCTVFSPGKEKDCAAFCSVFSVSVDKVAAGTLLSHCSPLLIA
jgi:hypothetical protein